MTLDSLVEDMVEAAERYPGINILWYRSAVETTVLIVSTFMGIALVALSVAMPLILALELMFINFPPLTAVLTNREDAERAAGVVKRHRNWGLSLNDARKAIYMSTETGTNINLCYFKTKWKTLITVSSIINVLIFGGDAIVSWVTKLIGYLLQRIAM